MGRHSEWRKIAKKERRRRIRRKEAQERCAEEKAENEQLLNDCDYQTWLAEQDELERFRIIEDDKHREEANEKWLRTELIAQMQWRQLQEKIAKARLERAEQDLRIKKEWEEQQKQIKEAEDSRKRAEEEQLRCHNELMERIEQFATGTGELPDELRTITETNPEKEICPFFSKIGICRFGDNCSRNHRKPGVSRVLLVKNFYSNFGMEQSMPNEYDTDILLEYDDRETYKHFKEFFDDVHPEFERIGQIVQFKVCCNFERHLRGNTYVEYESLRDAVNAYRIFHGRWFGGKQISVQFCDVPSWNQAICGLFAGKRCPKGKSCNFLHVFRNPGDLYSDVRRKNGSVRQDSSRSSRSVKSWSRSRENGRNWRWSESPEPISDTSEKSRDKDSSKRKRRSQSRSPLRSRNGSSYSERRNSSRRRKHH